jgi:hypothetical protein
MDPQRPNRILEEWDSVANQARRPAVPPRGVTVSGGLAGMSLAGVGLVAIALVAAVVWFGGRGQNGVAGIPPTSAPTESPSAVATPFATPSASVEPSAAPTPTPTPVPTPTPTPATPTASPPASRCGRGRPATGSATSS